MDSGRTGTLIRTVVESIPEPSWLKDRDGVYVACNEAVARAFGLTPDEILGRTDDDFVDAESARAFRRHDRRAIKSGHAVTFEEWFTFADDGRRALVESVKTPVYDEAGELIGVLGVAHEVTDTRRIEAAETALRESDENFRAFFETIGDMIVVGRPDGTILYANRAMCDSLGYSCDELSTMHVLDLHPADKRSEAEEIFAQMFRRERETCPLPLQAASGALVPVETRVWLGKWNGSDCIFGICKDLTAEQEALQRFDRLFRRNPAPMAVNDLPDRRFTDVNDAFLRTLGYERDEIIGKTSAGLGLFASEAAQSDVAEQLKKNGRIVDCELQARCKDGSIIDGLFSGEIIRSQGRDCLLTVMVDITQRKRVEEALTYAAEAANEANRAKSEFL
ncbi:MAG: PAS domain S-box protein, partial [Coriobacteriia bacterium]|nr:PAS domain S-box protein [Coriobacteriia bacterium]